MQHRQEALEGQRGPGHGLQSPYFPWLPDYRWFSGLGEVSSGSGMVATSIDTYIVDTTAVTLESAVVIRTNILTRWQRQVT